MPYIPSGEKMENNIAYIGDENLNKEAKATINRVLADNEPPVALAGFDFETKVIAITRQRVMIASENDGLVLNLAHGSIQLVRRDGRTLVIQTQSGIEHRYRFAKDDTVQELMQIARHQKSIRHHQPPRTVPSPGSQPTQEQATSANSTPHIAERVRFWEEQDRINQELIPRVVRQHELLTRHVSDHEMLPIVAAAAAKEAIQQAQGETLRQLEEARSQNQELARRIDESKAITERQSQELQESKADRERLGRELEEAKSERERLSQELEAARGERETLAGEVNSTKTEREEQKREYEERLSNLKRTNRTSKAVAYAACAAAATAIVIAIIL